MGDVHGGLKAMEQVLQRANYDPAGDKVIFLGDVADGWPQVPECFHDIIAMKNIVYVMGNHDSWLYYYLKDGSAPPRWLTQGGSARTAGPDGDNCAHRRCR